MLHKPEDFPEYMRPYVTISGDPGKNGVVHTSFYDPETTHQIYLDNEYPPPFTDIHARMRLQRFEQLGYHAVGGSVGSATEPLTTMALIRMHGTAEQLLDEGALMGPYMKEHFGRTVLMHGFRLFMPSHSDKTIQTT